MERILNTEGETVALRHSDFGDGRPLNIPPVDFKTPRNGRYMHTSSGRKYWPLDPKPDEVDINVVAHHLATRCRYNGATQHPIFRSKIFYSVAEHSVYVSRYVEEILRKPEYALEALLHDGSEAYNGDLIRPLKYDELFRGPFKVVEDLNEAAGAARFNLVYPYPAEVKLADEAVTTAEMQQIIPKDPCDEWESGKLHDDSLAAPYEILMLSPYEAKEMFLDRFEQVMRNRAKFRALP